MDDYNRNDTKTLDDERVPAAKKAINSATKLLNATSLTCLRENGDRRDGVNTKENETEKSSNLPPVLHGCLKGQSSSEEDTEENYTDALTEDAFSENEEEFDEDSSSSFESDGEVAFEHVLHHCSFYETTKKRRRRHIAARTQGKIPPLRFTGTIKTEFWHHYGVEPSEILQPGSLQGIDTIFSEDEFKKMGPTEKRIHVDGQKFKIAENREFSGNLYRAIAQAVGMSEDQHKHICNRILEELVHQWPIFCDEVCKYCGIELKNIKKKLESPRNHIETYRRHKLRSRCPPELELTVAAFHFGFTYAIVEVKSTELPVVVRSCNNQKVLQTAAVKYYFLKTGQSADTTCYEFLVPIGPLKRIHDGEYSPVLGEVILVEKSRPWQSQGEPRPKFRPNIGPILVGFALDHRVFFHRTTISHDLWSLLAELIFRKLIHAPQIKYKVMNSKHDFTLYYLACKAKKRYQVYGNASLEKIAEDFSRRFSRESPRGNLDDLTQAAVYFDFSYTVIGLDACGNFYWRDYVSQHDIKRNSGPYLAFFVKTMPDRTMFWYALEDLGRECPRESKLYQEVQAGDLRRWNGNFYFHHTPNIPPMANQTFSTKDLLNIPTQMLQKATKWASNNVGRFLRSSIVGVVSVASIVTRNVARSVFDIFKWMKRRRRVRPTNKTIQSLYIRENP